MYILRGTAVPTVDRDGGMTNGRTADYCFTHATVYKEPSPALSPLSPPPPSPKKLKLVPILPHHPDYSTTPRPRIALIPTHVLSNDSALGDTDSQSPPTGPYAKRQLKKTYGNNRDHHVPRKQKSRYE